jgi:Ca2+-binding EF-hand superfamily protein
LLKDTNKNGKINYTEFLAATIEAHGHISEDRIAEAFDRLDADGTGYISKADLRNVLGERCTGSEIDAMMESGDADRDGKISYREFLRAFRASTYQHMATVAGSPTSSPPPSPSPSDRQRSQSPATRIAKATLA